MEFAEYSIASLRDESLKLARLVDEGGYSPDCVAYLARGAWIIGETMADYYGVPRIELTAHRSGEVEKRKTSALLRLLPRVLRRLLRECEVRRRLRTDDGSSQRRTMHLTERHPVPEGVSRILLVDDSVDTGASILAALNEIRILIPDAEVRVAAINVFAPAKSLGIVDWMLMEGVLLGLPSSKDSVEYKTFCSAYEASLTGGAENA